MFETIQNLGEDVVTLILGIAGMLAADAIPGLISAALGLIGLIVLLSLSRTARHQIGSAKRLTDAIEQAHGQMEFSKTIASLSDALHRHRGTAASRRLTQIWGDYRTTLIEPRDPTDNPIQSTTPARSFFNVHVTGFGFQGWRFWPGLFVTVGLLLTFLGLVAALQQTGTVLFRINDLNANISMASALTDFLQIASSKFIMSMTGLLVSILLTLVIRIQDRRVESALQALSRALDLRVAFISLEHIAQQHLIETRQTKDRITAQNAQLIESMRQPLKEATKLNSTAATQAMQQISTQMSESLQDVFSQINQEVTQSMREISKSAFHLNAGARRAELASSQLEMAAATMPHQRSQSADTGFRQRATDPPVETLDGQTARPSDVNSSHTGHAGRGRPQDYEYYPYSEDTPQHRPPPNPPSTELVVKPVPKLPKDPLERLQSAIGDVHEEDETEDEEDVEKPKGSDR